MRRLNIHRHAKWAFAPTFVFLAASGLFGAVLLEDDFTDQLTFSSNWLSNLDNDAMSADVSGGSCAISNTSEATGEYYHPFETKPSTFTISFVLKSVSPNTGNAGLLFCRSQGFNGYYLTASNGYVALFRYVNGNSGNAIYYGSSADLNASDNKFTVSKQGSEIHIFVNDVFQGKVSDAQHGSGDVSLYIPDNTAAVFGAFSMTDTFTEGKPRDYFADNFDNGRSKYWQYLESGGEPSISDAFGSLTVTTGAGVSSWAYVNLEHNDFEARVEVRHAAGDATINGIYGIALIGKTPSGITTAAHFGITGSKHYYVWDMNSNGLTPKQSLAIKGAAGNLDVILVDTLVVRKSSASSTYEFIVNGTKLSEDYPAVDVEIAGIGVFSYPGMTIEYDNFEAKKEGAVSIKFTRNPNIARGGKNAAAKRVNSFFYDLRGRKRYAANHQASGGGQLRAAGVYVNQNGREVLTDRNKRKR